MPRHLLKPPRINHELCSLTLPGLVIRTQSNHEVCSLTLPGLVIISRQLNNLLHILCTPHSHMGKLLSLKLQIEIKMNNFHADNAPSPDQSPSFSIPTQLSTPILMQQKISPLLLPKQNLTNFHMTNTLKESASSISVLTKCKFICLLRHI